MLFSRLKEPPHNFQRGNPYQLDELKFQLSVRTKIARNLAGIDVWASYTTASFWQAFNSELSSPFRETNHEPELYASRELKDRPLGLRLVTVGLLHQSNGQGGPTSRSWNRLFADMQLGFDKWRFNVKPWLRLGEDGRDDNPTILHYVGRYELRAAYAASERHVLSFMVRNPFNGRYNAEVNWSFPIWRIPAVAQLYTGYGESLVDYDFKTTRIGIGVLLSGL